MPYALVSSVFWYLLNSPYGLVFMRSPQQKYLSSVAGTHVHTYALVVASFSVSFRSNVIFLLFLLRGFLSPSGLATA